MPSTRFKVEEVVNKLCQVEVARAVRSWRYASCW
jgi:hypothetical protein